ncbi:MAG: SLC13 family permease [Magnetococcales bacterium]|nr:SLC13 family permease [Magnetococcales bacterium]
MSAIAESSWLTGLPHSWLILAVLCLAVVLFAMGRISVDLISLGLLALLLMIFTLYPMPLADQSGAFFSPMTLLKGFANPALATVVALLIVGEGVSRTGALEPVAQWIGRVAQGSWVKGLFLAMALSGLLSAFVNNTPVVVIFIPILVALSDEMGTPPGRMMMPIAFIASLGGSCTLIGSSTNILVADFAARTGVADIGMFTLTPVALLLMVMGFFYLPFAVGKLLPDTTDTDGKHLFKPRYFTAELEIPQQSPAAARPYEELLDEKLKGLKAHRLIRGEQSMTPAEFRPLDAEPGDVLMVMGTLKRLKEVEWKAGVTLIPKVHGRRTPTADERGSWSSAELVISSNSRYLGRALSSTRFQQLYGVFVTAIHRRSQDFSGRLSEQPLRAGSLLVVEGERDNLQRLSTSSHYHLYMQPSKGVTNPRKSTLALTILGLIISIAAFKSSAMPVLAISGAFLIIASGCITASQGYGAVPAKVVLLIAASLALGDAMQVTQADQLLAQGFLGMVDPTRPLLALALFGLLVTIFTNIISNNATAILFAPVGISIAQTMQVSSLPFLIAVILGANAAFSTPFGYKTNLLVYSSGGYSFTDFIKIGAPLNLLHWGLATLLIPLFWPF